LARPKEGFLILDLRNFAQVSSKPTELKNLASQVDAGVSSSWQCQLSELLFEKTIHASDKLVANYWWLTDQPEVKWLQNTYKARNQT
jgi:hypothetical protein